MAGSAEPARITGMIPTSSNSALMSVLLFNPVTESLRWNFRKLTSNASTFLIHQFLNLQKTSPLMNTQGEMETGFSLVGKPTGEPDSDLTLQTFVTSENFYRVISPIEILTCLILGFLETFTLL